MGRQELIEALRRRGDEQARDLWAAAESEAEQMREAAEEALEEARRNSLLHRTAQASEQQRRARLDAERRVRVLHTESRLELAERLREAALEILPVLREDGYGALFARLVGELPGGAWDTVHVNPADRSLAEHHFPVSRLEDAPELTGGFIAERKGGRIRIDNSLDKRLERAWDDLLPTMLGELASEETPP